MFKFSFAVLAGLVLVVGADQSAIAATKTFYVGTCKPGKADFITIQEAVSGVPPGSIIDVCPGAYPEQVTITQPLTLQGVQSGGNAHVMITAPAGGTLVQTVPVSVPMVALVAISNSAGAVDISGLTVDGTGISGSGTQITGVLYDSSPGTLNQVVVQNLAAASGDETVAIMFRDDIAASPTNVVQNSTVTFPLAANNNPGVYGTSTNGGTITLSVVNNYVSGALTGILIEDSVVATVTGNVVNGATVTQGLQGLFGVATDGTSGLVKINSNSIVNVADGVLLESQSGTGATTVSNNTVVSFGAGIVLDVSGGTTTINGNQLITPVNGLSGSPPLGINFNCSTPLPTVAGNTIIGASIGLANVPSGSSLQKNAGTFINVPNVESLCQ